MIASRSRSEEGRKAPPKPSGDATKPVNRKTRACVQFRCWAKPRQPICARSRDAQGAAERARRESAPGSAEACRSGRVGWHQHRGVVFAQLPAGTGAGAG